MNWKMRLRVIAPAFALALGTFTEAKADGIYGLITNGGFEVNGGNGVPGYNTTLAGWTNGSSGSPGYSFVFNAAPGTTSGTSADNGGASGPSGGLSLWGPGNGSINGLKTSPDGGAFYAADGAYGVAPLTQTVSGLTVGQGYVLNFYWGGAQQSSYDGVNTEQWQVNFGSETKFTEVLTNSSHGFTGWKYVTMSFTATSTSQLLSFLAIGTPSGVPPFVLLDGVTMQAVPEPSTFALLGLGVFGIVGAQLRRRSRQAD